LPTCPPPCTDCKRRPTGSGEIRPTRSGKMVLEFPGLPESAVGAIISTIDRKTAADNGWTFIMLSATENRMVVEWLMGNSSRPNKAVLLWSILFGHMRRDTQEIMLSRDDLAARLKERPDNIIMSELEKIGAISRRRERIPGMRGPGPCALLHEPAHSHPRDRRCPRQSPGRSATAQARRPNLALA